MKPNSHKAENEPAQFAFSPIFAHAKLSLTPAEVARALGITDQQVRDLVEAGELGAFQINDASKVMRAHIRLSRSTVEAWWLEQWLLQNGREYPWPNSPEIKWWREELRKKRAGQLAPTTTAPQNSNATPV